MAACSGSEEGVKQESNVKHEARLTGSELAMQEWSCNCDESFELGAGQPLLPIRLFGSYGIGTFHREIHLRILYC